MNKKILSILLTFIFAILMLTACSSNEAAVQQVPEDFMPFEDMNQNAVVEEEEEVNVDIDVENCEDHEETDDYTWNENDEISIDLNGDSISADTENIEINGSIATITSAGTYNISGTLKDGQIIVDTEDEDVVRLILNNAEITSSSNSPLYVKSAAKTVIILADNTENYLTDAKTYTFEDDDEDEPSATLFSKSDLTIYSKNNGSLSIDGKYNDGISSKDGLIINGATIDLTAADDGIRGKDYLVIKNGDITVDAEGDGLKSDDSSEGKGYISIESGSVTVYSEKDAITATTDVLIADGDINIISGGGSNYALTQDSSSMKGIKALVSIIIDGGNLTVNSADDALHSNYTLVINDGTINLASGDDGMHANKSLEINDGNITITKAYEGIESSLITINDGNINIVAKDDGLNVAGGNDASAMGRMGRQGGFAVLEGAYLYIHGGYIVMDTGGDGLDSNGNFVMTDGVAIVNGPTNNGNGAIDYNGDFQISGGLLIAVGSSGMAEAPGNASTQYSVLINFTESQEAGELIHIQDNSGEDIVTFEPTKIYQSIAFSSSELEEGETYTVYIGGSSTGTETDGLYEDETYSPGTENTSFTISDITTRVGTASMGGGMMGGGMRGGMTGTMTDRTNMIPPGTE